MPASEIDLTPTWFRSVFPGPCGDAASLDSMERIGQGFGLSSVLFRCRLAGPRCPRSVVVKLWQTDGPAGVNEVRFYATFAVQLGIRVPIAYHGAIDETGRRGVLVLEDIANAVQGDCLRLLDAEGAVAFARMLARLHATWWNRSDVDQADWLPPVVERSRQWLSSRRGEFLRRFADRVGPSVLGLLDRAESVQVRAHERLQEAGTTLLHADLHLDNVVFDGRADLPVLLDWARVARGPAALDLAELLFAMAPIEQLEGILRAYLGELRQPAGRNPGRAHRGRLCERRCRRPVSGSRRCLALSATDRSRDRLAAFYHWNDRQRLDVAVLIALNNRLDWRTIRHWSTKEGFAARYGEFLLELRRKRRRRTAR